MARLPDAELDDEAMVRLDHADCIDAMRGMDEASVDAIVCDPPYGLGFMGKEWDDAARLASIPPSAERDRKLGAWPGGKGPQAVSFNGLAFQQWNEAWATEALRVLKPGGHLLAFGGTRTSHRLACAIEDAGFEIRDSLLWLYGSGFPKSHDVSKAIDKAAGAEREVVGPRTFADGTQTRATARQSPSPALRDSFYADQNVETAPATPEAEKWQGWGTALKPGHEPIVVARKPLIGTVAQNVSRFSTGALNIDATRIGAGAGGTRDGEATAGARYTENGSTNFAPTPGPRGGAVNGRWPSNCVLSHTEDCRAVGVRRVKGQNPVMRNDQQAAGGYHGISGRKAGTALGHADEDGLETVERWECAEGCPVRALDEQSEERTSGNGTAGARRSDTSGWRFREGVHHGDTGGASRFYYTAKASRAERNAGLEGMPSTKRADEGYGSIQEPKLDRAAPRENWTPHTTQNSHPTVKPLALMRWLCLLVTPPGVAHCPQCEIESGQAGVHGDEELRAVRPGVHRAPPTRSTGLPEVLREAVPGQAQRRGRQGGDKADTNDEGLHRASPAGAPDGVEAGLRDGAPSRDGGDTGARTTRDRGRASSQRDQGGQSAGESRSDAETAARSETKEAGSDGGVPPLPGADSGESAAGRCGRCGAGLVERPGVVLDPFCGSGTTGCAAVLEGFNFIGVEREAEYVEIARARIEHWEQQTTQLALAESA